MNVYDIILLKFSVYISVRIPVLIYDNYDYFGSIIIGVLCLQSQILGSDCDMANLINLVCQFSLVC